MRTISIAAIGAVAQAAARMEQVEAEGGEWKGDMGESITPAQIAERRRASVNTCNISAEEQAELDRPKSRQERRQLERLRRKGRV